MSAGQRIDRWLWHARLVKTRSLAAAVVAAGRVRINRARIAKPSHPVRPGDVVTVGLPARVCVLRVEAVAERRGPAVAARALYTDLSPPPEAAAPAAADGARPRGAGRPTKRERRQTTLWKDSLAAPDDGEI